MCIVSRAVKDERDLIRFVRDPEGRVVPDLARELPGRGVWVSLSRRQVEEAVRKKAFAKGFAAETTAAPDLPDVVARLLRQQALGLLGLARKAGQAVCGFTKVEELLRRGRARLLLHGSEAMPDGCRKLDRLAGPGVETWKLFRASELDLAFARPNVVHAAVAGGGIAEKLVFCLRRIEMFEAPGGAEGPEDKA
jgi:hypothetical protein